MCDDLAIDFLLSIVVKNIKTIKQIYQKQGCIQEIYLADMTSPLYRRYSALTLIKYRMQPLQASNTGALEQSTFP